MEKKPLKEDSKSFWSTLPGILTGLAAVITAIGSCIAIFIASPKMLDMIFPVTPTPQLAFSPTMILSTDTLTHSITPRSDSAINTGIPVPTLSSTAIPSSTPTLTQVPTSVIISISSTFDGIALDGWQINRGKIINPGVGGNTGDDNDGHLRLELPTDGITNYLVAPSFFHGDWRDFKSLRVDLWSSGGQYFTEGHGIHGDIYIANGDLVAYRYLPNRPPEQWETFLVPLDDDGRWTFGAGTMRLEDVLANVTDFQVRAEYGEGSQQDYSGLDNVSLIMK